MCSHQSPIPPPHIAANRDQGGIRQTLENYPDVLKPLRAPYSFEREMQTAFCGLPLLTSPAPNPACPGKLDPDTLVIFHFPERFKLFPLTDLRICSASTWNVQPLAPPLPRPTHFYVTSSERALLTILFKQVSRCCSPPPLDVFPSIVFVYHDGE